MPRAIEKLSQSKIARLNRPNRYADGGHLYLQVQKAVAGGVRNRVTKSWVFIFKSPTLGKVRMFGLGEYLPTPASVEAADKIAGTLEWARVEAAAARDQLKAGLDPLDARRVKKKTDKATAAAKHLAKINDPRLRTFREVAAECIATKEDGWKNAKHREQWRQSLESYAYKTIGDLPISAIETAHIVDLLRPVWKSRNQTAVRVRGRIKVVLDYATTLGLRSGPNPAVWDGHLSNILPKPSAVAKTRRQPSLPYSDLPAFMANLRQRDSISARALEFVILNAARTGAAIGVPWSEIDLDRKLWIVSPDRLGTKMQTADAEKKFVPLCDRAVEILRKLPREKNNPFVFIGGRKGQHLSDMALLQLMQQILKERDKGEHYVPHGFRATFKSWCRDATNHQNWVSEAALWHVVRDKTEAAYIRSTGVEKQREHLMMDWAAYCMNGSRVLQLLAS